MTDPSTGRPEPVTDAAKLAGAVAAAIIAVGGLLRVVGIVLPVDVEDVAREVSNVVLTGAVVWALVGPWLLARLRARDKVTPVESPRGEDGIPLITRAKAREWVTEAHTAALDQARDEYHAAMQQPADQPGHHAADRSS